MSVMNSSSGRTREAAMDTASVVLLRRLAMAEQHGERVPRPGDSRYMPVLCSIRWSGR